MGIMYMTVWIADQSRAVHPRLVRFSTKEQFVSRRSHRFPADLFIRLQPVFDELGLDLDCDLWDMRVISLERDLERHRRGAAKKTMGTAPKLPAGKEHEPGVFEKLYGGIGGSVWDCSREQFHKTLKDMAKGRLRREVLYVKYVGPNVRGAGPGQHDGPNTGLVDYIEGIIRDVRELEEETAWGEADYVDE